MPEERRELDVSATDGTASDHCSIRVEHLVEVVKEIFSEFLGVNFHAVQTIEEEVVFTGKFLVSMIGFVGTVSGLLAFFCSRSFALTLAKRLLGMPFPSVTQEVRDALGEIANMIAGNIKKHCEEQGHFIQISIPSVLEGDNFNLSRRPDTVFSRLLQFESELGNFFIQISIQKLAV
jgi:chemotaxis protein CheX